MQNNIQNERQPKVFGYSRVSTKDKNQTHARQLEEFKKHNVDEILKEKISGGKPYSKRPKLLEILNSLEEGDKLISTQLDRICRDMRDLQDIIEILKEKKATIHILGAGIYYDTRYPSAAAEMQLNMLGAFAQFERSITRERIMEGLVAARAKGNIGGRRVKYTRNHPKVDLMSKMYAEGYPLKQIAEGVEVSRTTLYKIMAKYPELFNNDSKTAKK